MTKIVYGARCVWWDDISKTARTPKRNDVSIPCCPHCGSVLFEIDEDKWWRGADEYEAKGNPGYRKFIEWLRGKCFPTISAAKIEYAKAHP